MLVDRRMQGEDRPYISSNDIDQAKVEENISVTNRADRLLKYLSEKSSVGSQLDIESDSAHHELVIYRHLGSKRYKESVIKYHESLAWSESLEWKEFNILADNLSKRGFLEIIDRHNLGLTCRVTIEGYQRVEETIMDHDISQALVIMSFGENMNAVYENGIKQAIENSGYKPIRIDRKNDINKVDDKIIAEIRRSRFLIADYTQGEDGARGSVYYEAGFASGLGIPVIHLCRKDMVDKLHFDTRQYYHIVWSNPEELRESLQARIIGFIGKGPLTLPTVTENLVVDGRRQLFVEGPTDKLVIEKALQVFAPNHATKISVETKDSGGGWLYVIDMLIGWRHVAKHDLEKPRAAGIVDKGDDEKNACNKYNDAIGNTDSAKCFMLTPSPHIHGVFQNRFNIPVDLESLYDREAWEWADEKGFLEKRKLQPVLPEDTSERIINNETTLDQVLNKDWAIFVRRKFSQDGKMAMARYFHNMEDDKFRNRMCCLEPLVQEILAYLFPKKEKQIIHK